MTRSKFHAGKPMNLDLETIEIKCKYYKNRNTNVICSVPINSDIISITNT